MDLIEVGDLTSTAFFRKEASTLLQFNHHKVIRNNGNFLFQAKEILELTAICDELIAKAETHQEH